MKPDDLDARVRCSKNLRRNSYRPHPCQRKAVVTEEGKPWCRQHAPSAVKARAAESSKRIQAHVNRMRRNDVVAAVKEADGVWPLPEGVAHALKVLKEAENA